MRKFQCPKCRNYFERQGLVIVKEVAVCIDCSKGNSGIVKKIPERRYTKSTPKTKKADKNREIGISPRLARFLKENGYKKTAFGVYRKLGTGVTEVHYYQNFDELERRFEKVLSKKAEESSTPAEGSTLNKKKKGVYECNGGEGHILTPINQMGV